MKTVDIMENICVKGEKTSCGSKMLENFVSPYNATIVEKMLKQDIILNKISMTEFNIKNEINNNIKNTAIISDLNCNIPTICKKSNLIAIKPTFGMVSRYGLIYSAPSLEYLAIISKNIDDSTELLNTIKGYDEKDSGSVNKVIDFNKKENTIKVAKVNEINEIKNLSTFEIEIKNVKYAKIVHYVISSAEASSSLAKFDGIRYGYRTKDIKNLKDVYKNTRKEGFEYETKKRMIAGTFFLDVNNRTEYYVKANKIRTIIKNELLEIFKQTDVIIVPAKDNYIYLASLTGRPSIITPDYIMIGNFFEENKLINLAKDIKVGGAK